MRVLVAGATGVLGRPLLRLLSSAGCQVIALGRPDGRTSRLASTDIAVTVADPFDPVQVAKAVRDARPDAVLQYLTAIPQNPNPRRISRDFAVTNRLRTETTKYLVDAAVTAGASRFISQSVAFLYDPVATPYGELANEDAPLWADPHPSFAPNIDAIRTLEQVTRDAGGAVLRFGQLYGPGTAFATDGAFIAMIRKGRMPLVSGGRGVFSFTHVDDAATAVLAALDRNVSGPLNIVDDTPVELSDWVPQVARMIGARAPRDVPALLARPAVGRWGMAFMTQLRGADNARAKLRLDWRPRHGDWRTGFAAELAAPAQPVRGPAR
jgi:nucleoside-diphosphate-sugar epimerase